MMCKRAKAEDGADIKTIAFISGGNDEFVSEMCADAIDKVGFENVLFVESSTSFAITVYVEEGIKID